MKVSSKQPATTVSLRNISIPIFERTDTKNGTVYRGFFFTYTEQGKRRQKRCTTLEAAKAEAIKVIRDATDNQPHNKEISLSEFAEWSTAMRILRKVEGITLVGACQQFVEASAALGGAGTLTEAAHHLRKSRSESTPVKVADLVRDFIAEKENEEMSDAYLRDIKRRLKAFALAFRTNISGVRTEDISAWLKRIGAKGRNSNNYRNAVCTLFSFARERGFLPRDKKTEAELLSRAKEATTEIGIYTPEQIARLLDSAPAAIVPAIAIGAFSGLRSTEIFRLDWEQVRLEKGTIEVLAKNAKTAQRRLVPVLDNLKLWLGGCEQKNGRVAPNHQNITNFSRAISRACEDVGIGMVGNGLRHSFASYRLATVRSADQVALEMGNSPRKLFSNYRELVTEAEAERWFAVTPKTPAERK